jgi:hypothetical protein
MIAMLEGGARSPAPWLQPPILQTEGVGTGRLGGREVIHAGVIGVVHEVVDGVVPWSYRAGVASDRTTGGCGAFRGRVTDVVSREATVPLERMKET